MGTAQRLAPRSPDREIIVTRVFNAPRRLVFKAWTDPKHVMQWWGPRGFTNPSCDVDLRTGGTFSLKMRAPDGTICPCDGIFAEVVEPERIVYRGNPEHFHACGGGLPPGSTVTVTFDEHDGKTTLTIHTQVATPAAREAAMAAGFSTSWAESLDRLAEYVAQM